MTPLAILMAFLTVLAVIASVLLAALWYKPKEDKERTI